MKKLICERINEVIKNREKLEEALDVKITNRGKEISIEGLPLEEYEAEEVINAINFGFKADVAVQIKERELSFEILNIKNFTARKNLQSIRARIIGAKGKTLKTLIELTDCFIEVRNNDVGIIGNPENMKTTQTAIISLIKGSKQANVYKYLEKHHAQPVLDLGLKEVKKKK